MIYFNGKIIPADAVGINPADRGFLLADGLFETMRAYQGKIFCLPQHWQRLKRGANCLAIPVPISAAELEVIARELLTQNHLLNKPAALRLTITRGSGPRGLLPPAAITPTVMLTAFPALLPDQQQPLKIKVVDMRRNELSPLANIKSLNYLDNILAKMAAVKAGADEAILLNSKNRVAGASAANIFIVTENRWLITPRLKDGALPGITRQVVINLAVKLGIIVKERAITVEDLNKAAEIFLTNSLIGVQGVAKKNTPTTAKLQQAYESINHSLAMTV